MKLAIDDANAHAVFIYHTVKTLSLRRANAVSYWLAHQRQCIHHWDWPLKSIQLFLFVYLQPWRATSASTCPVTTCATDSPSTSRVQQVQLICTLSPFFFPLFCLLWFCCLKLCQQRQRHLKNSHWMNTASTFLRLCGSSRWHLLAARPHWNSYSVHLIVVLCIILPFEVMLKRPAVTLLLIGTWMLHTEFWVALCRTRGQAGLMKR